MANANRVVLRESYEIAIDEPLPNYDNPPALAYRVRHIDDASRDLIGLICDPKLPTRFDLIAPMSRLDDSNIVSFQDWGIVDWPPEGRRCPILIYERPEGGRLMTSLDATIEPVREEAIIEQFVEPMYQVLREFRDQDIAHRAIRPTNVYVGGGGRFILGDCISGPPALAQTAVFETIESCMCMPGGRGSGTTADDMYALGVTVLTLMTGQVPCQGMSDEEVLEAKLSRGSYGALTQQSRISLTIMEVLRGLLNDDPELRWSVDDLGFWAGGRRGSPIQQSMETRAARSFSFMDKEHFTCRELAQTMSSNWEESVSMLRDARLDSWLRRALGDDTKIQTMNEAKALQADQDSDDNLVARACIALDPFAPVRFRGFRATIDGIANVLAMNGESSEIRNLFAQILQTGLIDFWEYCQPSPRVDLITIYRDLKRGREVMARTNLGEGIERVIYDLNPNLSCQSAMVESYYVLDIEHLLPALDRFANDNPEASSVIDRQIAAYFATHFADHRGGELRDLDNQADPYLPTLAAIRLLSRIQEKARAVTPYVKLAGMAAKLLEPSIKRYQSRETRKNIAGNLLGAAETGRLLEVLGVVDNLEVMSTDERQFNEAVYEYRDVTNKLGQLELEKTNRTGIAKELGAQVSSVVSGALTTLAFIGIFAYAFLT